MKCRATDFSRSASTSGPSLDSERPSDIGGVNRKLIILLLDHLHLASPRDLGDLLTIIIVVLELNYMIGIIIEALVMALRREQHGLVNDRIGHTIQLLLHDHTNILGTLFIVRVRKNDRLIPRCSCRKNRLGAQPRPVGLRCTPRP